jgi:hypothetical protein
MGNSDGVSSKVDFSAKVHVVFFCKKQLTEHSGQIMTLLRESGDAAGFVFNHNFFIYIPLKTCAPAKIRLN